MKNTTQGPQFIRYFEPVITALKELGNSGKPKNVREIIIKRFDITDEEINKKLPGGAPQFENQVAWARFYLLKGGYLDAPKFGVWGLTQKGIDSNLTEEEAFALFKSVQQQFLSKGLSGDHPE